MSDERKDDVIVARVEQKIDDFIERYDRDCGSLNEWRRTTELELKDQSKMLNEISPAYMRGKWVVGLITIGSLGIAIKAFWSHLSWH